MTSRSFVCYRAILRCFYLHVLVDTLHNSVPGLHVHFRSKIFCFVLVQQSMCFDGVRVRLSTVEWVRQREHAQIGGNMT